VIKVELTACAMMNMLELSQDNALLEVKPNTGEGA
jgi:hypothetical protein